MGGSTETIRRLEENVGRVLVGKPEVVRLAVIGLVARRLRPTAGTLIEWAAIAAAAFCWLPSAQRS